MYTNLLCQSSVASLKPSRAARHGVHALGLGRVVAGRALKRPPRVPALTLFLSLALTLAEAEPQRRHRRRTFTELAHCCHHAIVQ